MIPLLISSAGLTAAVALYYGNPRRLVLRALPILFLFLILSRLEWNIMQTRHPGKAIVLIDLSQSFRTHLPAAIQELKNIGFPHSIFFFAESLVSQMPDTTGPYGSFTDITRALADVQEQNPSSIILITDGNHNFGEPPIAAAARIPVPVNVFAAGAEMEKNIAISDITYPQIAYAGDSVRIKVELTSAGFDQGTGRLSLKTQGQNFQTHETFALSMTKARSSLEFEIPQIIAGTNTVFINVAPQPGESGYDDNKVTLAIRTYDRAVSVLYITDHLSFNTRHVLAGLKTIEGITLSAYARLIPGSFRDLIAQTDITRLPDPASFDIIVLDNARYGAGAQFDLAHLLDRAKGLLIMGSCEQVDDALRAVLPIAITGNQVKGDFPVQIVSDFSNLKSGNEYPPFEVINQVLGVKTDATVIAESNKVPLIAYRKHSNGYVFQINALDLGTWDFSQQARPQAATLPQLTHDIIRFLSPVGRENRLVLKSFAQKFPRGEPVTLKLESYDRNFNRKGGGDFYAVAGNRKIPFFETAQGFYEASFMPDDKGNITVTAYGLLDNDSLKSHDRNLVISGDNVEIRKSINRILLSSLAESTGGQFYALDRLAGFVPPAARPEIVKRSMNLDHPVVYILIFVLLAADWILRRIQGAL
ncbi:MAG TPA: hypothetical protein VF399_03630 [bacterium]